MAKIIWSTLALEDLRAVYDYVSLNSPSFADRLVDTVIQRVEVLKKNPRIGRIVPEFSDENIRELIEGSYRIIYKMEGEDKIGVARIHHSSRLLKDI
jgi:toxin ParE1/3/4